MIKMKKTVIAIVCVIALVLSLPMLAFAAPSPSNPEPAAPSGSSGITFVAPTPTETEDEAAPQTTDEAAPTETEVVEATPGPVAETPSPVSPPSQINDPTTPEASSAQWALLNLILAIVSLVFSVVLAAGIFTKSKESNSGASKSNLWGILAVVVGLASPIVFLLTEKLTLPMGVSDTWSPLMAAFLLVQIVLAFVMLSVRKGVSSSR